MKRKGKYWSLSVLVICLLVSYSPGIIGWLFVGVETEGEWYMSVKPDITPPGWVFPIVWNILYFLIGISLWLSWTNAKRVDKRKIIGWYGINLILNGLWSWIYFGIHRPGLAFIDLIAIWITILGMMNVSYKIDKKATWLILPYFLWVSFAGILNYLSIY